MARTIVVTGSASGLGRATANKLEERGDRVITVDLNGGDIVADLSTRQGREEVVTGLHDLAPDGIDGIATWAGLGGGSVKTLLVNYFGTVDLVEGVHDLLVTSDAPRVVITSSRMSLERADAVIVEQLLNGEVDSVSSMYDSEQEPMAFYKASKTALARWMRRTAVSPEWGGRGIAMNAIAPGLIETPMTRPILGSTEGRAPLLAMHPQADTRRSQPEEIASLAAYLLSEPAGILMGQCIFADRGTEAILRGDETW